ncbi:alpha/beta hydrolase [Pseudomonas sp. UL073]|uniref:Alpha/beta hydrolase n=1 Tax=Zestomonas insulae TaxID=2809017 RepID=A0ABS2IB67_9GAMM|nr:alpha/beta hydrolase [Pseudomonas insulae]
MKPDIVFIHGMWSRHTVWRDWEAMFRARGYNCVALDLPGHEEHGSDTLLARVALEQYVNAVVKVARGLQRPVLIGHSLGGLIGQLAAQRLDLAGLVLVNSAAPGQVFPLRPAMLPGLVRHFSKWALWRKTFRLSAWEADYLVFNRLPAAAREDCRKLLIAESGKVAYEVGFGVLNLARSNRVQKERVSCPMLALAGGRDRIIPRAVSRGMARWYGQQLDYREYPAQGHWLLGEPGWEGHVERVMAWIETFEQPQAIAAARAALTP